MIKLKGNWMGAESNNRVIVKGEYADNDPALFGLGNYLVSQGHALKIETIAPIETEALETLLDLPVTEVDSLGIDPAQSGEDTTIETLVELSHDEPAKVIASAPKKSKR